MKLCPQDDTSGFDLFAGVVLLFCARKLIRRIEKRQMTSSQKNPKDSLGYRDV